MPYLHPTDKPRPLWRKWEQAAEKAGLLHGVFSVSGNKYVGEWMMNKKHGKGVQLFKSGGTYDGEWQEGQKEGFGVQSVPDKKDDFLQQYAGEWRGSKRMGYGTQLYGPEECYVGEWRDDARSGWGRMQYADGSVYEGQWLQDQRHGHGMLVTANGSRYEGTWQRGLKNGPGRFHHTATGQVQEGVWLDDIPRCSVLRDIARNTAETPTQFPIPKCELQDPETVLSEAMTALLSDGISPSSKERTS